METRPAGVKVLEFFADSPLGEEILEGTMGGLMAGASQFGSDKSAGQIGLETAAAILGGIGLGAAGRRIGARVGQMVHKDPLKDQGGTLAFIGRTFGNETTAKGLKENAIMGREALKESLVQNTSARMAQEAMQDPAAFSQRYGLEAEQFNDYINQVKQGRTVAAALKTLESMSPEQRKVVLNTVTESLDPTLKKYQAVENAVTGSAYDRFDDQLKDLIGKRDIAGQAVEETFGIQGLGDMVSKSLEGLDRPVQQVTGEQVGKAVGRFLGDEVGILGGMAAGSLLAQQLGMEGPKDRKIRELQDQLTGVRQG